MLMDLKSFHAFKLFTNRESYTILFANFAVIDILLYYVPFWDFFCESYGGIIWSKKILDIYDSTYSIGTNSFVICTTNIDGYNKEIQNWGNDILSLLE